MGAGCWNAWFAEPMAETTPLHNPALPREEVRTASPAQQRAAPSAGTILRRALFWSYQRGSWQYDVIVVLILAFIFLSQPLFRDQPALQLSDLRHNPGIVEVSHDATTHTDQIDARLLESLSAVTPELAAQSLLEKSLNRTLIVQSVEKIRDRKNPGVVLGYKVVVKP